MLEGIPIAAAVILEPMFSRGFPIRNGKEKATMHKASAKAIAMCFCFTTLLHPFTSRMTVFLFIKITVNVVGINMEF